MKTKKLLGYVLLPTLALGVLTGCGSSKAKPFGAGDGGSEEGGDGINPPDPNAPDADPATPETPTTPAPTTPQTPATPTPPTTPVADAGPEGGQTTPTTPTPGTGGNPTVPGSTTGKGDGGSSSVNDDPAGIDTEFKDDRGMG